MLFKWVEVIEFLANLAFEMSRKKLELEKLWSA